MVYISSTLYSSNYVSILALNVLIMCWYCLLIFVRYGDHLNPWGDVIAMARAWCVMKPTGRALVGLPTGKDEICFNAHRKYGPFLYSQLFVNWKIIHSEIDPKVFNQRNDCWDIKQQMYQPITILEKST